MVAVADGWGWVITVLPAALGGAWLLSWFGARLALAPWRAAANRDESWAERARLAHPGRLVAGCNVYLVALASGAIAAAFPSKVADSERLERFFVAAAAGYFGSLLVKLRVETMLRGRRVTLIDWLYEILVYGLVLRFPVLCLIVTAVFMNPQLDAHSAGVLAAGIAAVAFWAVGGTLLPVRLLGAVRPAGERTLRIVKRAADRVGICPKANWEVELMYANAYALPVVRMLAFTRGIVEALDDEQIEAIAVHELGHLAEPRRRYVLRSLVLFVGVWLPGALVQPVAAAAGWPGFAGLLILALATLHGVRVSAGQSEAEADAVGTAHEAEEGAYARALESVYRANVMPVTLGGGSGGHQPLYDRMRAAGVPPDYPRPRGPSWEWFCAVFAAEAVAVAAVLISATLWSSPPW